MKINKIKFNKKKYLILLSIFMLLLAGCTPKLHKMYYNDTNDILFQYIAYYYPDGYKKSIFSNRIYNVLSVVKDELIFGEHATLSSEQTFTLIIHKSGIIGIEISENNEVITIKTNAKNYCFLTNQHTEEIYKIITNWLNTNNN